MTVNEHKAALIVDNKKLLMVRLNEAKSALMNTYRKHFRTTRFSFEDKCLYGTEGYYLKFRTRLFPDKAESYGNQQTNRGIVTLHKDNFSHLRND